MKNNSPKDFIEQIISDHGIPFTVNRNGKTVNTVKGIFSKFSTTMERHSWITNAIASIIFSWLSTKIG